MLDKLYSYDQYMLALELQKLHKEKSLVGIPRRTLSHGPMYDIKYGSYIDKVCSASNAEFLFLFSELVDNTLGNYQISAFPEIEEEAIKRIKAKEVALNNYQ